MACWLRLTAWKPFVSYPTKALMEETRTLSSTNLAGIVGLLMAALRWSKPDEFVPRRRACRLLDRRADSESNWIAGAQPIVICEFAPTDPEQERSELCAPHTGSPWTSPTG